MRHDDDAALVLQMRAIGFFGVMAIGTSLTQARLQPIPLQAPVKRAAAQAQRIRGVADIAVEPLPAPS